MLEFYKEPGITPLDFINTIKKQYPDKKICYTARLDPMARGKIPVLFGEECKNMHHYTNLSKTYEVKVMIGYKTDSDDVLGILENTLDSNFITSHDLISNYKSLFEIENEITNNTITQKYHYFSTKALLARSKSKNNTNEDYTHDVKLFTSKIIDNGELDLKEWINECITIINKVDKTKDFRQKEIIEQWKNIVKQAQEQENTKVYYITLQLYVGSGFFVRQYIRDISNIIGIPLMCYDIHRVSIDYK
jgi:tRNA U55 pseudouridine synthase TruB